MKKIILISSLLPLCLVTSCGQKTAGERTEEIDNFADPVIQSYNKAKDAKSQLEKAEQDKLDSMKDQGF